MLFEGKVLRQLALINVKIDLVLRKEFEMAADLSTLTTQVQANTDVEASAIVLINGIAAQLAAAKNDPVAVQALVDKLNTSAGALAAAVTANTPAAA
jgi:hypothetical protein